MPASSNKRLACSTSRSPARSIVSAPKSKKKPVTTSSDGDDARRRREGAAAPRDAGMIPRSERSTSVHPVKVALRFHVDSPWRTSTSLPGFGGLNRSRAQAIVKRFSL